jgi:hypothetical protein
MGCQRRDRAEHRHCLFDLDYTLLGRRRDDTSGSTSRAQGAIDPRTSALLDQYYEDYGKARSTSSRSCTSISGR